MRAAAQLARGDGARFLGRKVDPGDVAAARHGCSALRPQGLGMPTVSGETLALPPLKSSQAFACTAGNTAFCAASPDDGANRAPRLVAYLRIASLFEICSVQILSSVFTTSSGTPLGRKMPK